MDSSMALGLKAMFGHREAISWEDFFRIMKTKLVENRAMREASEDVQYERTEKTIE
jgi:hypothetical protein